MQGIAAPTPQHPPGSLQLELEAIGARAGELDAAPRFPRENFQGLLAARIPQLAADRGRCNLAVEIALVRSVAGADASTARILDGHFNGVERLAMLAEEALRAHELESVAAGSLLLGVWGADPAPGEGPPARIETAAGGALVLRGVKTFCSGAGGLQRAVVVARDRAGARRLAYVDLSAGTRIDRSWYRAAGLRSSESHRVEFSDAPVLALLGGQDELMREPWFSRDAVRTSATWAGLADCILRETLRAVAGHDLDDLRLHALGTMRVASSSIDLWLAHALAHLHPAPPAEGSPRRGVTAPADAATATATAERSWQAVSGECRIAIAAAARTISQEAARVGGSRAMIGGSALERARRDLDLFLLQHRLDPQLAKLGAGLSGGEAP